MLSWGGARRRALHRSILCNSNSNRGKRCQSTLATTEMFHLPLSPLQRVDRWLLASNHGVEVWVKRDDLLFPGSPALSGNKLRKLSWNLRQAVEQGKEGVVTFGGAYSNHIAAVAAAGKRFGFRTVGFVRGDEVHCNRFMRNAGCSR